MLEQHLEFRTRQEIVCGVLREAILSGELEPGTSLNQQELATRFNVSRMPIREAIRVLASEGLVQVNSHRGTTVMRLSRHEIRDLFDLRELLEGEATKFAIGQLSDEVVSKLEQTLTLMEEVVEDSQSDWIRLNEEFHSQLYRLAERPILIQEIERLRNKSQPYLNLCKVLPGRLTDANLEHRDILEACINGDREIAAERVMAHLGKTKEELIKALAAREGE